MAQKKMQRCVCYRATGLSRQTHAVAVCVFWSASSQMRPAVVRLYFDFAAQWSPLVSDRCAILRVAALGGLSFLLQLGARPTPPFVLH